MRLLGYTLVKTSILEHEAWARARKVSIRTNVAAELLARNHNLGRVRCDWCGRAKSKTPKGRGLAI